MIGRLFREIFHRRLAKISLAMILFLFLMAVLGAVFAPYDYNKQEVGPSFQGPSWKHLCGTDDYGRDMFSRILGATGTTAMVSILYIVFGGLIITVLLGIISGYYGGWIDTLIMRTGEILYSIPTLYLVLLIAATLRPGYNNFIYETLGWQWLAQTGFADLVLVFGAISLFAWVVGAKTLRARVLQIRELGYIEAAKALGASDFRIMFHHILPNLLGLIILSITSTMGFVIGTEIALSFLGFGIRPPHPSFGVMFFEMQSIDLISAHPYLLIFPGIVVVLWILSFSLLRISATDIAESRKG